MLGSDPLTSVNLPTLVRLINLSADKLVNLCLCGLAYFIFFSSPWSCHDVDRRKKTGSRRRTFNKEDLVAEDSQIW